MIELFEHHKSAYEAALALLEETHRACVIHPTGTGRSFIAFKWAEDNPDARFAWLSPSENIFKELPHNARGPLAGEYQPLAACKNLDYPPGNL